MPKRKTIKVVKCPECGSKSLRSRKTSPKFFCRRCGHACDKPEITRQAVFEGDW